MLSSWCCDCSHVIITYLICVAQWFIRTLMIKVVLHELIFHLCTIKSSVGLTSSTCFIWWTRLRCFWCWHHRAWLWKGGWISSLCPFIQDRSELQMAAFRLTSGVQSLTLLRWTYVLLCAHGLSCTVGCLWLEQLVLKKGRFLLERTVSAAEDTQIHRH